jgi:hypothetical protein
VHRKLLLGATALIALAASQAKSATIGDVFVISMENQNWTQPANQFTGGQQQVKNNPAAPFLNNLIQGNVPGISDQTAYTDTYYNVLASPTNTTHIHPSEPNYIWSEAGSNRGVLNDNQPFQSPGGTNQTTNQHLTALLNQKGVSWKSYQEDIDIDTTNNTVLPKSQWVSPIQNKSGTFSSPSATPNQWNGSKQFDYAVKHNPMALFNDTNGGNNTTPSNPAAANYAPLQQLAADLGSNSVARYNWITPDQFNDMHNALSGGFTDPRTSIHYTGDAARIAQGDNFLSQVIPMIMASQAYQDNGAIVLWWDETEQDGVSGDNPDDLNHTIAEIVISKLAHPNVDGLPYDSLIYYTHSSDLRTMQDIFQVSAQDVGADFTYLGDAANANTLADLFAAGVIPDRIPEPGTILLLGAGLLGLGFVRRRV